MMLFLLLGLATATRRSMKMVGGCSLTGPGAVQAPANGNGQDGTVDGQAVKTSVFKDGFWSVGCRFDEMQVAGDKYGDEKDGYEKGKAANTSIVRYDEILDRENQEKMSPEVCFNFCRTVPEMTFFGLVHGRDCYCMHYYLDAAGGSGVCDLPCEGGGGTCGGAEKSSIYQMHACEGGLAQDLEDTTGDLQDLEGALGGQQEAMASLATDMQASGDALEAIGDAFASPLAQEAKVVAGPLTRAAEDLATLNADVGSALGAASEIDGTSELSFEDRRKAEDALARSHDLMDAAEEVMPAAAAWAQKTDPNITLGEDFKNTFVPILRQVEPELERSMAICTGDTTGEPMVGLSFDECTQACDDLAPQSSDKHCISVQYFELAGAAPLCFMFKKLTELTVFGCEYEGDGASALEAESPEAMPEKMFLETARKHVRRHKHHKHAKKHAKKHSHVKVVKSVRKTERRLPSMLSHPSLKYVLQDLSTTQHHVGQKGEGAATTCAIRYSSTYGVTPKFFDGMTKLQTCFGA